MKLKHALYVDVARKTSVQAALVENELAYQALKNGRTIGGLTTICVKWGSLDEKFDYLEDFPDEEEQGWLVQLEKAGIIQLDYDDDDEEWIVSFETKYLIARGAYNG